MRNHEELFLDPIESKERPNFGPRQVLLPEELVIGNKYLGHCRPLDHFWLAYAIGKFEVIDNPKQDPLWPSVRVRFEIPINDLRGERIILLGYWGVTPKPSGRWHPFNWVEKI